MATAGPVGGTGLPPDPERYADWKGYAAALSTFFSGQSRITQGVQPQTIQLAHVNTTTGAVKDRPRALDDGIIAFDPTLARVVLSQAGVWSPLPIGGAGGDYLPLSGGTLTGLLTGTIAKFGNLYIGASPTGVAAPNSITLTPGAGMGLRSGLDAGNLFAFINASNIAVAAIEPSGASVSGVSAIITREKGDARYVNLTAASQTITGDLTVTGRIKLATTSSGSGIVELGYASSAQLQFQRSASLNYIMVPDTASTSLRVQTTPANVAWATVASATGWTAGSDERLKQDIQPLDYGLAEIMRLQPKRFRWRADDRMDIGLLGQDVRGVIPEAVVVYANDPDFPDQIQDMLGLHKDSLIPVLIRAVQQQQAMIETLMARLT